MNWQEFTALLVLATAMSFTPGPNTTLSTALAANGGLRRAMPFVCAVPLGWSALLLLCAWGLGALVLAVPLLALAVKAVLRFFTARLPSRLVGEMHACLKKSVLPQQSAVLPPSEQAE